MAYSIDQIIAEKVKKELVSIKTEVVKLLDSQIENWDRNITYEQERVKDGTYRDRPR